MKLIFIIIFSIVLTDCSNTNDPSEINSASDFMPLTVGNVWHYQYGFNATTILDTVKVTAVVDIHGVQYYYMYGSLWNYRYLRCDGSKLYRAVNINNVFVERVVADFSYSVNQSTDFIPYNDSGLKQKLTLVSKTDDEFMFTIDDPNAADDEFTVIYKRGVGIKEAIPGYGISLYLVNYHLQ